jgi:hypothetical protein
MGIYGMLHIKYGLKLDKMLDKYKELHPLCIKYKHEFELTGDYNKYVEKTEEDNFILFQNVLLFSYDFGYYKNIDNKHIEKLQMYGDCHGLFYNQYMKDEANCRTRMNKDELMYSDVIFYLKNREIFDIEINESLDELWVMINESFNKNPTYAHIENAEILNKKRVKEITANAEYYESIKEISNEIIGLYSDKIDKELLEKVKEYFKENIISEVYDISFTYTYT